MSDNTVLNLGAGGDTSRAIDKAGVKTQVVTLDLGGSGVESLVAGTVPVSGTVAVSGTVPVSGSFFQATQPVSIAATVNTNTGLSQPLTDTQLRATPVPVSGTVSTGLSQPLTDTQLRAVAVPVSGTFFQTTQPVSIASMPSTPVTGTFFQATQPVSIAATVNTNTGLTQPLTDTQLRATAVPVSIAATINTSAAVSNFPATQAVSLATNTPDVTDRAARVLGVVTQAPLTKGTQGTNGVTTQDLKDSGRVAISFTAEFSPVAVAEAMLTMSVSKDGATATTGTSYVITSGKRLRVASKSIAVENTLGTSIQRAYLRTRFAVTGGALITSPLQANCIATAAGTVKSTGSNFDDYPDGLEFLGDGTKAIGWSMQAPDWVTASATLKVYVTIIAFEY